MQICDSNILLKDQDAIFGALLNCLTLIDLFETLPYPLMRWWTAAPKVWTRRALSFFVLI